MTLHIKIISSAFLLCFNFVCIGQTKKTFTINGHFINADGRKVYLIKRAQGYHSYERTIFIDSTIIKNSSFVFKGFVKEPDYYSILFKNDWKPFILDNSTLAFNGNAKEYLSKSIISGSKENQDLLKIRSYSQKFISPLNDAADSSMAAESRGDSILAKKYAEENQLLNRRLLDTVKIFIKTNPNSFSSLYELNESYLAFGIDESRLLYNGLNKRLKNHSIGKELKYKIFVASEIITLNKKMISFSQNDTSGQKIDLSKFKGKYLLIDFWASWCGPCRAENPNLKIAYTKYKTKGFEVLSISLDNEKTAWTKAIINDGINWTNVSDLKGWKNEVAVIYVVNEVPTNYLIDRQGKIIDKNLKGEALQNRLKELLGD